MADQPSAEDVERRLRAGEWLKVTEVAVLFDVDRGTVHRWVRRYKLIDSRPSSPVEPDRGWSRAALELNPRDVLALLAKKRPDQGGDTATAAD